MRPDLFEYILHAQVFWYYSFWIFWTEHLVLNWTYWN